MEPSIQVFLKLFHRDIKFLPEGLPQKLIENGPIESLHETIGSGPRHLGSAVLDVIDIQEDLIGMDHGPPAVFTAIVRKNMFHLEPL